MWEDQSFKKLRQGESRDRKKERERPVPSVSTLDHPPPGRPWAGHGEGNREGEDKEAQRQRGGAGDPPIAHNRQAIMHFIGVIGGGRILQIRVSQLAANDYPPSSHRLNSPGAPLASASFCLSISYSF